MKAAERDKHLNFAVKLWADSSRTWPRLYRIVEEIYVSFRDKDAEFAGPDSRHAMHNNKPPQEAHNLSFLPHAEAVSFVRECLKRALVCWSREE